jgi:predicted transcriptional regulator
MPDSVSDQLTQDLTCESLLECFHGLTPLDRAAFEVLVRADGPLTVDELAEAVDRERSTAYRSVRRLCDAGFVRNEQVNYADGGYYHVFEPVAADVAADRMQRLLNDWYAKVGQLIEQYRGTYADAPAAPVAAEH